MNQQERNAFIMERLNEGMSLSDVQKALVEQFNLRLTYFELRMLASELEVDWKKQDKAVPAPKEESPAPQSVEETDEAEEMDGEFADELPEESDGEDAPAAGKTKVTVSKLLRPGAAICGEVEFSSGAKGEWFVDNMGRLGFDPAEGSGQPTQKDLREFQMELRKELGY